MKKINICMLLTEPYDLKTPARPPVMVISASLIRLGHQVTWIMPAKEDINHIQEKQWEQVQIFVIPSYTGSALTRKILTKFAIAWKEVRLIGKIIREDRCNIVLARDDVFSGLVALYLRNKYKILPVFWYINLIGSFSQERYKLSSNWIFCLIAKVECTLLPYIMRRVDLILLLSKRMQESLNGKRTLIIPSAVDTRVFSPSISGNNIRRKYDLNGLTVVLYIGTLDRLRCLNTLIYAINYVKQNNYTVKLLMLGYGDDKIQLEKLVNVLGLKNDVIFIDQVPYYVVPQFIAASDIGVSPVPPKDVYKISSPLKLVEYMAMGKPVVANKEIYEHEDILRESGGGILVPFTAEAFAGGITELINKPEKAKLLGLRGRDWVTSNRTYDFFVKKLENECLNLI